MAGISYADFEKMTYGEIATVIERYCENRKTENEAALQNAAFAAYQGAYLSRVKASSFPKSIVKAFPALFGRDENGNIPAENWRESKRAMAKYAEKYAMVKGASNNGGC